MENGTVRESVMKARDGRWLYIGDCPTGGTYVLYKQALSEVVEDHDHDVEGWSAVMNLTGHPVDYPALVCSTREGAMAAVRSHAADLFNECTIKLHYVSVWDGGREVRTSARYDFTSGRVFNIKCVDVPGAGVLEAEYLETADGKVIADFWTEDGRVVKQKLAV
jgi:hypothetical protein